MPSIYQAKEPVLIAQGCKLLCCCTTILMDVHILEKLSVGCFPTNSYSIKLQRPEAIIQGVIRISHPFEPHLFIQRSWVQIPREAKNLSRQKKINGNDCFSWTNFFQLGSIRCKHVVRWQHLSWINARLLWLVEDVISPIKMQQATSLSSAATYKLMKPYSNLYNNQLGWKRQWYLGTMPSPFQYLEFQYLLN